MISGDSLRMAGTHNGHKKKGFKKMYLRQAAFNFMYPSVVKTTT